MSRLSDREAAEITQRVAARAVRRLDMLEWVILGGAMLLALGGGALVAWILAPALGTGFRPTWVVLSLGLFVIPGAITLLRNRRSGTAVPAPTERSNETKNG